MGRLKEACGRKDGPGGQQVGKNSLFDKLITDENLQKFLTLVAFDHLA